MKNKKYIAGVLALALGLGIAAVPSAEAAPAVQSLVHEQNVRKIRFEFRRDGDQEKYDRAMKEEQRRHDRAVKQIKRDYDQRTPWRR